MSEPKQILAVDEQKATLDFLRSVLPLAVGDGFEIRRALSAEEGLLELRRKSYDLLIAGLRLPGMDGLTMARRARRLDPEMPIILATARPLPELRDEAAASGVSYFLRKPLDAEEFLAAVQESFAASPRRRPAGRTVQARARQLALPDAIAARLESLRAETGAGQVLLATVPGEVLHMAGRQLHPDIARLVAATAASVSCSLQLSEQLDDRQPQAIHFLQGAGFDLYWANIDHDYFIIILFDAQIRRGRIGTVWVFAQRAVAELKTLLVEPAGETAPEQPGVEAPGDGQIGLTSPVRETPPQVDARLEAGEPSGEAIRPESEPVGPAGEIATGTAEAPEHDAGAPPPAGQNDALNLDAFWDEALASDSGGDDFSSGISLAEAKKKGLIAEDFDPET